MNNFSGMGRIGKELEKKSTQGGKSYVNFSIGIKRDKDNTDWINCVAWEKTADLICNYHKKGDMIGVVGSVRTRDYEKDGKKVYVTEILVNSISFCNNAKKEDAATGTKFDKGDNYEDVKSIDSSEDFPF